MGRMVRKQIYIEPQQEATLKRLAQQLGVTEAEMIRQAIDRQMQMFSPPRRDIRAWQKERAFIRKLIQQGPAPGKRTWKREELHGR